MFWILFFVLLIVSALSFQAGCRLNYTKTHNDTQDPSKELVAGSNDKIRGLRSDIQ